MNALAFLNQLRPAIPLSIEQSGSKHQTHQQMSNGELRRHIQQGSVLFNAERISIDEPIDFPIISIVFFPNSPKRRTTIW